jgi:hypothetical protein
MSLRFVIATLRCDSFELVFELEEFSRELLLPHAVSFWVNCECRLHTFSGDARALGENLPVEIGTWLHDFERVGNPEFTRAEFAPQEQWMNMSVEATGEGLVHVAGCLGPFSYYALDGSSHFSGVCAQADFEQFVRELKRALK